MTSDARAISREEDDAVPAVESPDETTSLDETASVPEPEATTDDDVVVEDKTSRRRPRRSDGDDGDAGDGGTGGRTRPSLPLVPVLAVLLVLLLAGVGFLWFTSPGASSVTTDDYVDALQAARLSECVSGCHWSPNRLPRSMDSTSPSELRLVTTNPGATSLTP